MARMHAYTTCHMLHAVVHDKSPNDLNHLTVSGGQVCMYMVLGDASGCTILVTPA